MPYALLANPNQHFYETRNKPVTAIVLHITAGLQDLDLVGSDHSAAGTNRYGATTKVQASWHKCVDTDSIDDALPDHYTAFHCRGFNSPSLGLEISNKDARWDNKPDKWIHATLLNAARVCLAWEKKFGIPRRLISAEQAKAGVKGYTYHSLMDPTRRSDPGKTFPINRFWRLLAELEGGQTVAPVVQSDVHELQRILHLEQDGKWGKDTDLAARKMRTASMYWAGYNLWKPEPITTKKDIREIQKIIGAKQDGVFGPQSLASLQWFIKLFQVNIDLPATGGWNVDTEAGFHKLRDKFLNKF